MRAARIILALFLLFSIAPATRASADDGCGAVDEIPSGCREFSKAIDMQVFRFTSFVLSSKSTADVAFAYLSSSEVLSDALTKTTSGYTFGPNFLTYQAEASGLRVSYVLSRVNRVVSEWIFVSTEPGGFGVLNKLFVKMQSQTPGLDDSSLVHQFLPTLDDLPIGFKMVHEDFLGGISASSAPSQSNSSSSTTSFSKSGSGSSSTRTFSVQGDWELSWAYNCSNFGMSGNFIVMIYNSDGGMSFTNMPVNQLGTKGSGTEHYHSGGSFYFQIISECSWSVSVYD